MEIFSLEWMLLGIGAYGTSFAADFVWSKIDSKRRMRRILNE